MKKHLDSLTLADNRTMKKIILFSLGLVFMLFLQSSLNAQNYSNNSKGRLIKKDGVTAFIVRDSMEKSVKLTMLIAHKSSFSERVTKMVGRSVIPLTFSISTSGNERYYFDPKSLHFTQGTKEWSLQEDDIEEAMIKLNESEPFGGFVESGKTQQAVILLPAYFDIDAPLYVNYDQKEVTVPMMTSRNGE